MLESIPMISRTQVVEHFGSVAKAAEFFGIAPQAVYQWPEDAPIPRERELELMVRIPEKFAPERRSAGEARAAS